MAGSNPGHVVRLCRWSWPGWRVAILAMSLGSVDGAGLGGG